MGAATARPARRPVPCRPSRGLDSSILPPLRPLAAPISAARNRRAELQNFMDPGSTTPPLAAAALRPPAPSRPALATHRSCATSLAITGAFLSALLSALRGEATLTVCSAARCTGARGLCAGISARLLPREGLLMEAALGQLTTGEAHARPAILTDQADAIKRMQAGRGLAEEFLA